MCVIYFVWYFNVFFYYIFSKILATNIDSITSYSKIREEIKFMYVYVCMYDCTFNDGNGSSITASCLILVEKHLKFPIAHLELLDQKTPIDTSDQRENCSERQTNSSEFLCLD